MTTSPYLMKSCSGQSTFGQMHHKTARLMCPVRRFAFSGLGAVRFAYRQPQGPRAPGMQLNFVSRLFPPFSAASPPLSGTGEGDGEGLGQPQVAPKGQRPPLRSAEQKGQKVATTA